MSGGFFVERFNYDRASAQPLPNVYNMVTHSADHPRQSFAFSQQNSSPYLSPQRSFSPEHNAIYSVRRSHSRCSSTSSLPSIPEDGTLSSIPSSRSSSPNPRSRSPLSSIAITSNPGTPLTAREHRLVKVKSGDGQVEVVSVSRSPPRNRQSKEPRVPFVPLQNAPERKERNKLQKFMKGSGRSGHGKKGSDDIMAGLAVSAPFS